MVGVAAVEPESNVRTTVPVLAAVELDTLFVCLPAVNESEDVTAPALTVTEVTVNILAACVAVPVHEPVFDAVVLPYDELNVYVYDAVLVIVADLVDSL